MKRYHFDNCEKNPILSSETINRINLRKDTLIRRKEVSKLNNKGRELKICPYCLKESYDALNMSKYHFDNCSENPDKEKPIYTCIYCGTQTSNKTNIIRFHNENCKNK
jgi:hypothetical protein